MSSTAFQSPETVAAPLRTFELQFIPVQRTVLEFPHPDSAAHDDHNAEPHQPNCLRGIRSALVIEAVVAVVLYGLWQVSHLLR